MSLYRFEAKIISRGGGRSTVGAAAYRSGKWATRAVAQGGRSAVSAAAYRSGEALEDERTGQRFDYTKKRGVLGAEIMLPDGAPTWMADRSLLWNAVETIEKRKDAQLARDFILALPHELSQEQRVALTRDFVKEQFCDRGFVADIAWHAPSKDDSLNYHAHVMTPMRRVEGTGFAAKKDRPTGQVIKHPAAAWKEELQGLRIAWEKTANRHLKAAGLDVRIDHRSLEAQGIDREPEPKVGPLATQMENEGRPSRAGDDRRAVQARNAERARLKLEHAEATTEVARLTDLVTYRLKGKGSDMEPEPISEEQLHHQLKRQELLTRELRETQERLDAFKARQQQIGEEAKRDQEAAKRDADRRDQAGDIADAKARYSIALGEQYDVRDPYGSLSRAAMQEYAMFHRRQEQMREQIANEQDPDRRQVIELKRQIEGCDYMAITSDRLAGISEVLGGRSNTPQALIDRERAGAYRDRARELREERSQMIEMQQEMQRGQGTSRQAVDRPAAPPESRDEGPKRDEAASGDRRKEGPAPEMTERRQAQTSRAESILGTPADREAAKARGRDPGGGRGGR